MAMESTFVVARRLMVWEEFSGSNEHEDQFE
jgi:hypothetical protein